MTLSSQERYQLLQQAQTIAVVGHSHKPHRDSYQIAQFLRRQGYTVFPVNPRLSDIDGHPCYPDLQAVPQPIDIVNVFRRSEFLPNIVAEAIAVQAGAVWAQLGISHPLAEERAAIAQFPFLCDLCIKIEYGRLGVQRQR